MPRDKARKAEWQRARQRRIEQFITNLKSVPCTDCGNKFPPECMDFDHVRGHKAFKISNVGGTSFRKLIKEIEKCEIVCANCHRTRHKLRSMSSKG
jgi:hypothetical protein